MRKLLWLALACLLIAPVFAKEETDNVKNVYKGKNKKEIDKQKDQFVNKLKDDFKKGFKNREPGWKLFAIGIYPVAMNIFHMRGESSNSMEISYGNGGFVEIIPIDRIAIGGEFVWYYFPIVSIYTPWNWTSIDDISKTKPESAKNLSATTNSMQFYDLSAYLKFRIVAGLFAMGAFRYTVVTQMMTTASDGTSAVKLLSGYNTLMFGGLGVGYRLGILDKLILEASLRYSFRFGGSFVRTPPPTYIHGLDLRLGVGLNF